MKEVMVERRRLLRERVMSLNKKNKEGSRSNSRSRTPDRINNEIGHKVPFGRSSPIPKMSVIQTTQFKRKQLIEENSKRFKFHMNDSENKKLRYSATLVVTESPLNSNHLKFSETDTTESNKYKRLSRQNSRSPPPNKLSTLPQIPKKSSMAEKWIGNSLLSLQTPTRDGPHLPDSELKSTTLRKYRVDKGRDSRSTQFKPFPIEEKVAQNPSNSSIIQRNMEFIAKVSKQQLAVNVQDWIKRNKLDPSSKVFIVSPNYPDIKTALENRGWFENPDIDSNCFHFKFTVKGSDLGYGNLENFQIVNHFEKVANITTKSGLCKSVKNMIWASHESQDSIFPKCFDFSEEGEFDHFTIYYRQMKAEGILKLFRSMVETNNTKSDKFLSIKNRVDTAMMVTRRRLCDSDDIADFGGDWYDLTEKEWEILKGDEKDINESALSISESKIKKNEKGFKIGTSKKGAHGVLRSSTVVFQQQENPTSPSMIDLDRTKVGDKSQIEDQEKVKCINELLRSLEAKFPQTRMNGSNNVWIAKPSKLSRGRGIKLFDNYRDIYSYTKASSSQWVVQKYMENPLLFEGRKLDIRQWVLVSDWNPLTIWFYGECYIRLSTSQYDLSDISNRFSHLTNNSVNKRSNEFEAESSFLSQNNFAEHLKQKYNHRSNDPFFELLQPKMKKIVIDILLCVQDMVENRKNSAEMFGFDFCIDDELKVWLIEVNASPAWDYSSVGYLLTFRQ